jgi:hypothetical protein
VLFNCLGYLVRIFTKNIVLILYCCATQGAKVTVPSAYVFMWQRLPFAVLALASWSRQQEIGLFSLIIVTHAQGAKVRAAPVLTEAVFLVMCDPSMNEL